MGMIHWQPDVDGAGFKRGNAYDDGRNHDIAISVPGLGKHGMNQNVLFINGKEVCACPSLERACRVASQYIESGLHLDPRARTPAIKR
jgi:hypothetical protein